MPQDNLQESGMRGPQGEYNPLYPGDLGRALFHPEMDYNLDLIGQIIHGYRVMGTSNDGTINVTNDVNKVLKLHLVTSGDTGLILAGAEIGDYVWIPSIVTQNVGPQGNQGNQGTQGPQGRQGSQGNQGRQGSQGNQGTQGPSAVGTPGAPGDTGPQGNQGPQGFQGPQGHQGSQGSVGNYGGDSLRFLVGTWNGNTAAGGAITFSNIATPPTPLLNIVVSNFDADGGGTQTWFASMITQGGSIRITRPGRTTEYLDYRINSGSTGGQTTLFLTYVGGTVTSIGSVWPVGTELIVSYGRTGPQGNQGNQGTQGFQGPQGTQGFQGPQGTQGNQGQQGNKGGLLYEYGGGMSFNNPDPSLATTVTFNEITEDGANVGDYINSWQTGGTLVIQSNTNGDPTYTIFNVTGVIINQVFPSGTEYIVQVEYIEGTAPTAGEICVANFSYTGTQGPQGDQGPGSGSKFYYQELCPGTEDDPVTPTEGSIWYNSYTGVTYIYVIDPETQIGTWATPSQDCCPTATFYYQPTCPETTAATIPGSLWYNNTTGELAIYAYDSVSDQYVWVTPTHQCCPANFRVNITQDFCDDKGDGTYNMGFTAAPVNGVGPFSYAWSFASTETERWSFINDETALSEVGVLLDNNIPGNATVTLLKVVVVDSLGNSTSEYRMVWSCLTAAVVP
jgi:hypothetical protein